MNAPSTGARQWNIVIDAATTTLRATDVPELRTRVENCTTSEFESYVSLGGLPFETKPPHKKALEFFFSQKILRPSTDSRFLDLAGGRSDYLASLKLVHGCKNLWLNDQIFESGHTRSDGVIVVAGDAAHIPLPDGSIDLISCHHSFEHFQGDTDSAAIREIARLLNHGGRACIIPFFLTRDFVECWNIDKASTFDPSAKLVIDHSASIPGADADGHFARFYNPEAAIRRVIAPASSQGLRATVVTCQIDGADVPNMKANFGSKLNYPLHALVLEKSGGDTTRCD